MNVPNLRIYGILTAALQRRFLFYPVVLGADRDE